MIIMTGSPFFSVPAIISAVGVIAASIVAALIGWHQGLQILAGTVLLLLFFLMARTYLFDDQP